MKKKWISIFLAVIMISLLMPVAVFAEEETVPSPAISIGARNIEIGNKVYMGLQ